METKKLKFKSSPKTIMKIPKGKLSEELEFYPIYTLSSNDLQALSWAFALGGIGLKEALVDCSWRLKKNRSEPIEPEMELANVGLQR